MTILFQKMEIFRVVKKMFLQVKKRVLQVKKIDLKILESVFYESRVNKKLSDHQKIRKKENSGYM